MTTVDAPTLDEMAREALALLIQRHELPTPRWSWSHLTAHLSITFDCDADVDAWAKALLRQPAVSFTGRDVADQPDCWSVVRTYGFDIAKWMGVGVSLSVRHNEHRRVAGGGS